MKNNPIKEKIFVKNPQQKKIIDQWEKYDSLTKRVLYKTSDKYRDSYKYLKVSFQQEHLLISLVECKIVVYPNSEFVQKKAVAYFKLSYQNNKVFAVGFKELISAICVCAFKGRKPKILDTLEMDFLKKEDFRFIETQSILKQILLKKITNSQKLFKEYLRLKIGKFDKLPLTLVKEQLLKLYKFYPDEFCEVDYLRILKTSKNMHKTINDMERISKYKFIEDLSKQASLLKEKVNYNRSTKSLDNTHQEFAQRILEIRVKSRDIVEEKIYHKELPILNNIYPLQTELDFFREGKLQNHCVYEYYQKALKYNTYPYNKEDIEYMYFSYRKEKQILATIEIKIDVPNDVYKIIQMQGKQNEELPDELSEEVTNNLEIYCNKVLGISYIKNV